MEKPYQLIHADCLEAMKGFADNSVDAIVTDPPYELGFMNKGWDKSGIAYNTEVWREALRVLKFGGHLLAFGSSRTYHRLAVAIEDAGFEIRDQIQWIYGSGFPKSLDVSKAIDKTQGAEREITGNTGRNPFRMIKFKEQDGVKRKPTDENITAPATDEAKQWNGFGTALKPSHEPIVMARKPLEKGLTIAQNVLKHGTGAINIDGCRIGETGARFNRRNVDSAIYGQYGTNKPKEDYNKGRFPANLIYDGSDEVEAEFAKYGESFSSNHKRHNTADGSGNFIFTSDFETTAPKDKGTASRFFYCAKASKRDRNEGLENFEPKKSDPVRSHGQAGTDNPFNRGAVEVTNHHPTVKPTELMRYLCRLITPPKGTILDPFCGSGSTGKAAMLENFNFIGIEKDADYFNIAQKRIESATNAQPLFANAA